MHHLRSQRFLATWIAIAAILLAALMPSISHAIGVGQGPSWIEVCTSEGSKWIPAGSQEEDDSSAASHLLSHCPGCGQASPAWGLPPAADADLLLLDLQELVPAAFLEGPRTQHAWTSAQQRAPPTPA